MNKTAVSCRKTRGDGNRVGESPQAKDFTIEDSLKQAKSFPNNFSR